MRRFAGFWVLMFATGCALHAARTATEVPQPSAQTAPVAVSTPSEVAPIPVAPDPKSAIALDAGTDATAAADDADDSDSEDGPVEEEAESHDAPADGGVVGNRYTADLSDEQLTELWKKTPEKLGSISIGFTDEGRMVNSVQFPCGEGWTVVSPERTWATQETIDDVERVIRKVLAQYPDSPPLRVNQISAKDGGYLRPHKSHQSGRDVDLAFYYPTAQVVRAREREKVIDVKRTWALLRAVITETDVQKVLLDRHVQKVLYDYALKTGDDKAWLDSIFHAGKNSIVIHARRHRDHMHVRFFNPRAQELGRRVAPLLALRPEQNLVFHRVHQGDTLGAIARRYGTTVEGLRRANHIKGSMLHLAQVLRVPLRGPCTRCPIPPEVVVPPRDLPPQLASAQPAIATAPVVPATSSGNGSVSANVDSAGMKSNPGVVPPTVAVPIANSVAVKSVLATQPPSPPAVGGSAAEPNTVSPPSTIPVAASASDRRGLRIFKSGPSPVDALGSAPPTEAAGLGMVDMTTAGGAPKSVAAPTSTGSGVGSTAAAIASQPATNPVAPVVSAASAPKAVAVPSSTGTGGGAGVITDSPSTNPAAQTANVSPSSAPLSLVAPPSTNSPAPAVGSVTPAVTNLGSAPGTVNAKTASANPSSNVAAPKDAPATSAPAAGTTMAPSSAAPAKQDPSANASPKVEPNAPTVAHGPTP